LALIYIIVGSDGRPNLQLYILSIGPGFSQGVWNWNELGFSPYIFFGQAKWRMLQFGKNMSGTIGGQTIFSPYWNQMELSISGIIDVDQAKMRGFYFFFTFPKSKCFIRNLCNKSFIKSMWSNSSTTFVLDPWGGRNRFWRY